MLIKLLVELFLGGVAAYIAGGIMKTADRSNWIMNVILGIIGGVVGGFLGNLLGVGGGWITGLILAIAGSCLLIWAYRKFIKS
ncbi:MAG: GlsB/YeaQ/YmgE family stress response membrane protein [Lachnospiraceae bacterium]|nr:GlsB/YeaQ/YmgE family stress response membrane protein [Lachnospiraceae bacterium]